MYVSCEAKHFLNPVDKINKFLIKLHINFKFLIWIMGIWNENLKKNYLNQSNYNWLVNYHMVWSPEHLTW